MCSQQRAGGNLSLTAGENFVLIKTELDSDADSTDHLLGSATVTGVTFTAVKTEADVAEFEADEQPGGRFSLPQSDCDAAENCHEGNPLAGGNHFEIETEANSNDIADLSDYDTTRPHMCSVCNKRFSKRKHLTEHRRIHSGDRPFQCPTCPKSFARRTVLHNHQLTHEAEKLNRCSLCQRRFATPISLRVHMNVHEERYRCDQCGKCFPSFTALTVHGRGHSGEKPFQCAVCEKRYPKMTSLRRHQRVHSGERPHKCDACGKDYVRSGDLRRHFARVHSGEKRFKCLLCEKAFADSRDLQRHLKSHTQHKPFACSICSRGFKLLQHVKIHKRNCHSDVRPYVCQFCGKRFKMSYYLKTHVVAHTGARPFSCGRCPSSFKYRHQLNRHMLRSHDVGLWYTCDVCSKRFDEKFRFRKHVAQHEAAKTCSE